MTEQEKQKQITEIENIVEEVAFVQAHEPNGDNELSRKVSEAIVNAGFGDIKQAVKEFAAKVKRSATPLGRIWVEDMDELVKETCGK